MKKPEEEEEPAICLSKIQLSGRGVGGEVDTHAGSFSVLTSQPSLERREKKTAKLVIDLLCDPRKVTLPL